MNYSSIVDDDYSYTGPIYYSSERLGDAFTFWRRSITTMDDIINNEMADAWLGNTDDRLTYNQMKLILETLNGSPTLGDFVDSLNSLKNTSPNYGLEKYFNVENPRFYQAYIIGADLFDIYIDAYLHIDLVNEKFRWYYYDYRGSDVFLMEKSLTGLSKLVSREGLV